jgi:hypothetical protein
MSKCGKPWVSSQPITLFLSTDIQLGVNLYLAVHLNPEHSHICCFSKHLGFHHDFKVIIHSTYLITQQKIALHVTWLILLPILYDWLDWIKNNNNGTNIICSSQHNAARFEVLSVVLMNIQVDWNVMLYCWLNIFSILRIMVPSF